MVTVELLPAGYGDVDAVVLAGMGGSAMGGDLVRGLIQDRLSVPMIISRDYLLPAFVDGRTLVILSSYSGTTEETLSAFQDASDRGAKLIALGGGGKLLEAAPGPVGRIHARGMPRACTTAPSSRHVTRTLPGAACISPLRRMLSPAWRSACRWP